MDLILVYIGLMPFAIFLIVWKRLGGWPEAWYRISAIPYFAHYIFQSDGTPYRHVHKMEIIKHHSPASFDCNSRKWNAPKDRMAKSIGRPALYHNHDNMNPIPLFNWISMTKEEMIPPDLVFAAYKNDTVERMHGIGKKHSNMSIFLIVLAVSLVAIIAIAGLYYSYNTFCAVTPEKCGLPRVPA